MKKVINILILELDQKRIHKIILQILEVLKEVLETLNKKNIIFEDIIHLRPTYPSLLSENIEDCYRWFKSNPQATSLKSVEKLDLLYEKCFIEDQHNPSKLIGLNGDEK